MSESGAKVAATLVIEEDAFTTDPLFLICEEDAFTTEDGQRVQAKKMYTDRQPENPGVSIFFPDEIRFMPVSSAAVDLKVRVRCVYQGKYSPYYIVPQDSICNTPLTLMNSPAIIGQNYMDSLRVGIRNTNISSQLVHVERGASVLQLVHPSLRPANVQVVGPDHPVFKSAPPPDQSNAEGKRPAPSPKIQEIA